MQALASLRVVQVLYAAANTSETHVVMPQRLSSLISVVLTRSHPGAVAQVAHASQAENQ